MEHFTEVSRGEWGSIVSKMVSLNEVKLRQIPSEFKPEIRKTGTQRDNYAIAKIGGNNVFIYTLPDEYYGIFVSGRSVLNSFKCDQIDGLISALEFIKSSIK